MFLFNNRWIDYYQLFWTPCRWLGMAPLAWFTKLASLTARKWWLLRRSSKIRGSRSGYNMLILLFTLIFSLLCTFLKALNELLTYMLTILGRCCVFWPVRIENCRSWENWIIATLSDYVISSTPVVRRYSLFFPPFVVHILSPRINIIK